MIPAQTPIQLPADSTIADSAVVDSLSADSAAAQTAIIISPPDENHRQGTERTPAPAATSWILTAIILLSCLVSFRFRKNLKYIRQLASQLTDNRQRRNMFDDTARETFFLFLLNILFCLAAGITLYFAAETYSLSPLSFSGSKLAICCGLAAAWEIFLLAAYSITGFTFLSKSSTTTWIKGFIANQGLLSLVMILPSILLLFYPGPRQAILAFCIALFIIARITFICKGLRIFFYKNDPILLFLCYLCSLEIVPILITYETANAICAL